MSEAEATLVAEEQERYDTIKELVSQLVTSIEEQDKYDAIKELVSQLGGGNGEYQNWEKGSSIVEQTSRIGGKISCGRIQFAGNDNPVPYIRVPWKLGDIHNALRAQVVLYFVEHVWGLPLPKLVLSITGGAQDFSLSEGANVLYQLIEAARSTEGWITTGGTHAGIMKYVGEARNRFGGNVPLIGIAPWTVIRGNDKLIRDVEFHRSCTASEPVLYNFEQKLTTSKETILNPHHSHLILIDTQDVKDNEKFGSEIEFRGLFESLSRHPKGNRLQTFVTEYIEGQNGKGPALGWQGTIKKDNRAQVDKEAKKDSAWQHPAVCVCFEGGPNTMKTVLDEVKHGTAVVVIKGSGRAAELLADAVRVESMLSKRSEDDDAAISRQGRAASFDTLNIRRILLLRKFMQDLITSGLPIEKDKFFISYKFQTAKTLLISYAITGENVDSDLIFNCVTNFWNAVRSRCILIHTLNAQKATAEGTELNILDCAMRSIQSRLGCHSVTWRWLQVWSKHMKTLEPGARQEERKRRQEEKERRKQAGEGAINDSSEGECKTDSIPAHAVNDSSEGKCKTDWTKDEKEALYGLVKSIDKHIQKHQLKLMIEWNRVKMVESYLKEFMDDGTMILDQDVIDDSFLFCIQHDKTEIAALLIAHGADAILYSRISKEQSHWKALLLAAYHASHHNYVRMCTSAAAQELRGRSDFQWPGEDVEMTLAVSGIQISRLQTPCSRSSFTLKRSSVAGEVAEIDIEDDVHALVVLDRVYSEILSEKDGPALPFSTMPKLLFSGMSTDFQLFLFMTLFNKPDLAKLFWKNDGKEGSSVLVQTSLVACLMCRCLANKSRNELHGVKDAFLQTAAFYENFATRALERAYNEDANTTLKWVVNRNAWAGCPNDWTTIDLIVKGQCEQLIQTCSSLCIDAVQIKFSGNDGYCNNVHTLLSSLFKNIRLWQMDEAWLKELYYNVGILSPLQKEDEDRLLFNFPLDDDFLMDVIAHVVHTFIFTALLLVGESFMLEIVVLLLFLFDEVPDLLLSGIQALDNTAEQDISAVIDKGLERHFSTFTFGEVFEFLGTFFFLSGFIVRHFHWTINVLVTLASALWLATTMSASKSATSDDSSANLPPMMQSATSDASSANLPPMMQSATSDASRFRYFGVVVFLLFLMTVLGYVSMSVINGIWGLEQTSLDISYVFYGMSIGIVWFRNIVFLLVQRELGQFVRVMLNMGRDLSFFGIVWGILILAFSTMMLGAEKESLEDEGQCTCDGSQQKVEPGISSGPLWWLLRTYLQSLGSDQVDEMTTPAKLVIFIFMYPIFNVVLVNLLVAILSDRYEEAKDKSRVAYCFELYNVGQDYSSSARTNMLSIFLAVRAYWTAAKPPVADQENETGMKGFVARLLRFQNFSDVWAYWTTTKAPVADQEIQTGMKGFVAHLRSFQEFLTNRKREHSPLIKCTESEKELRKLISAIPASNSTKIKQLEGDLLKVIRKNLSNAGEIRKGKDFMLKMSREVLAEPDSEASESNLNTFLTEVQEEESLDVGENNTVLETLVGKLSEQVQSLSSKADGSNSDSAVGLKDSISQLSKLIEGLKSGERNYQPDPIPDIPANIVVQVPSTPVAVMSAGLDTIGAEQSSTVMQNVRKYTGILWVTVGRCINLKPKFLQTRDPYVKLKIRDHEERTKAARNTQSPKWNDCFGLLVQDVQFEVLEVMVFQDDISSGRFVVDHQIGECKFWIRSLVEERAWDREYESPLGPGNGKIVLRFRFEEIQDQADSLYGNMTPGSTLPPSSIPSDIHVSGILKIKIFRAKNLPQLRWSEDPNPYVILKVGSQKQETGVLYANREPIWNEQIEMYVRQPGKEILIIEVVSRAKRIAAFTTKHFMGEYKLPVSDIIDGNVCGTNGEGKWIALSGNGNNESFHLKVDIQYVSLGLRTFLF